MVRVVDPTGAGDAYCGGFIVGSLLSGSAVIAAACGTVAAGETIGIGGGVRRRAVSRHPQSGSMPSSG